MDQHPVNIVWFRRDLRLADHAALDAAIAQGNAVVPIFIWSPEEEGDWAPGAASRVWIHETLRVLDKDLRKRGSRLVVRRGSSLKVLQQIQSELNVAGVFFGRRYEPVVKERDEELRSEMERDGVHVEVVNTSLLFEPGSVLNGSGKPYKVFSAFWRQCQKGAVPAKPIPPPKNLKSPTTWPKSMKLDDLNLVPDHQWVAQILESWTAGESGAAQLLNEFLTQNIDDYSVQRDFPGNTGTSRLSAYLAVGAISPRQIWHSVVARCGGREPTDQVDQFLRQLGWREFAYSLLHHFPHTVDQPLRSSFNDMPWRKNAKDIAAWKRGQTGYPMVDAAMRELWKTGWMHNRSRMIVASFLVKHILVDWREGARWFWDTLIDADLANNTLGWQWVAGCGADAAPYFRIFNPTLQGRKFDKEGSYIGRWVPELEHLPARHVHAPEQVSSDDLQSFDVILGETYPRPIVEHTDARDRALAALEEIGN